MALEHALECFYPKRPRQYYCICLARDWRAQMRKSKDLVLCWVEAPREWKWVRAVIGTAACRGRGEGAARPGPAHSLRPRPAAFGRGCSVATRA